MANRIKGITIEIDGKTDGLTKALNATNKSLKTTQTNLRDVNKLLKLDPTNVNLLKQKQDLLKKAVEDTKKKLDTEKEALRQLKEGDQTPEVLEQQKALERQIAEDEAALKSAKKELKDFGSVGMQQFSAVGAKVKEAGQKMTELGQSITKNVTGPLMAVGGATIAAFKSVDDAYDIMIKKTGATGDAAQDLKKIMEDIAGNVPAELDTIASAIGEVSTRYNLNGDDLEKLAEKYVMFADLNDTDVSDSIDKTQKALAAYGYGSEYADAYLDRLNKTSQDTAVNTDKLSEGIVQNATAFKAMGLSLDEATVFMGLLEKSGVNSETVLNGMRKALKNATAEGIPLDQALSDLQNTILNGTGTIDGLTAAYDLFGKSGDQIYEAVRNGSLDFEDFAFTVEDASGNVARTFEETQDPIDNFKIALNQLKITGAEVGTTLLEMLNPAIDKVRECIEQLKEKWDALTPEQQQTIIKIGMIIAAIGPIITILGTLTTLIGALMSPIGLVILAIAGIIAIGVALYKHWEDIKEFMKGVKDSIVQSWADCKEGVKSEVERLKNFVSEKWNALKTNTANAWAAIKGSIERNGGGIKGVVKTAATVVQNAWSGALRTIDSLTGGKLSSIYNWFKSKFDSVRNYIQGIVNWLKGIFNFQWSLPSIKLPHFSWSWESIGGIISIPRISVSWYKKAYDTPYLFTNPTVVNGRGFGDGNGAEFVYGRDQLMRDIAAAKGGDEITINVYASEGMSVRQLADEVQARLAQLQRQKEAAYA